MKKLQELNVEELLKELENSADSTQIRTDGEESDVLTFLNVFNLKPGNDPVRSTIFYQIYRRWSKTPVKRRYFINKLSIFFNKIKTNFFINEREFKIKRSDWNYFAVKPKEIKTAHNNKRNFEAFIENFKIQPGKVLIHFSSLEILYSRFINETRRKRKMSPDTLFKFFRLYLKEKHTKHGSYFHLSENIWNYIDQETYNEKEKNKKKHKKISSIDSGNEP
jgi:hypothetical protein